MQNLCGRYVSTRSLLDYNFHKFYSKERQLLQDDVISYYLKKPKSTQIENRPKIILTAGAMGAGKTHTVRKILADQYKHFVVADVDKIKYHLPEMKTLLKNNPNGAGAIVHSEACTIHEIIFRQAISEKKNVIIDGSLRNADFFKEYLACISNTTNYYIMIIHVVASLKRCMERAEKRSKETGRVVPIESIALSLSECPKSVEKLKSNVDCVITIDNENDHSID